MIRVQNLVKEFGQRRAVDDVSFEVAEGTVLGFLGPNGAGKTTTIRIVAGFLAPTSGSVRVEDVDVVANPIRAQKNIGYMPESTPLYDDMTVRAFLRFIAEVRGFAGRERDQRVDRVLESCFLGHVKNQVIDTLSKGYRQRTCFAQALLHDPKVLLLDEPTEGLDPNQKQVVRTMIAEMAREKVIMLSTHVLEEVEAIGSRVIIISGGRIVADSTPAELKRRSRSWNAVILQLAAPLDVARREFEKLPEIESVHVVRSDPATVTLRLVPKDHRFVAPQALDFARRNNWAVHDIQTDSGRLDEVFRQITTTEDAA